MDLITGKPIKQKDGFLKPLKDLANKFPYPGDRNGAGTKWTLDVAAVVNLYNPGWLFIGFTQPYFNSVYSSCSQENRKETARIILQGIMEFARKHDFLPVIVSSGGLISLKSYITAPSLKGNLQSSAWSYNLAGVYKSEPGDKHLLTQEPHIRAIIPKDDFILPYFKANNCRDWYSYAGYTLYYTLITGNPFYRCIYPPIFNMSAKKTLPPRYPMSSLHRGNICETSLGRTAKAPTAAVGNRSITTHSMVNANLTVECYIRSQANMGVLVAVNEDRYQATLSK